VPAHSFTLDHFPAAADDRTRAWTRTVRQAFLEPDPAPGRLEYLVEQCVADDATLVAAYPDGEETLDGERRPVGTCATMAGTINLGAGLVPATLFTSATVRPTHRRRGLLRRMVEDALVRTAGAGHSMLLLTATEGSIYERFGFGAAVWRSTLTVDTRGGLPLRSRGSGQVQQVGTEWLVGRAPAVFDRFHEGALGSVSRRAAYADRVAREGDSDRFDRAVRGLAHVGPSGEVDGFAFYKALEGTATVEVLDLVAATDDAYLALWSTLGGLDLVDTVTFPRASADEVLRHAVVDPRRVSTTLVQDELWVRVLDPAAALAQRAYAPGTDETLVLRVHDPLGHASGDLRLRVADGLAVVEPVLASGAGEDVDGPDGPGDEGWDLSLDVSTLGTLLVGALSATQLARSARLVARDPATLGRADRVFAIGDTLRFYSHF
jgi:predicted acetyltransferase